MDEAVETTLGIAAAARQVRGDQLVICHRGPFDEPENAEAAMLRMPGINGFYGASSMERLPVERAITDQVRRFESMKLG